MFKPGALVSIICVMLITSQESCKKGNTVLPACIGEKINTLKAEAKKNPPVEVWQYRFRDEKVYFISSYCCDIPSIVLDDNCNTICSPDGGIAGNGDGRCTNFHSEKKDGVLIWRDGR